MIANTKERILACAFTLFLRKGYKAVTLHEIEFSANITRGTFYYYFNDKGDVLKQGIQCYYKMLDNRIEKEYIAAPNLRCCVDYMIQQIQHIRTEKLTGINADIPEVLCISLMSEVIVLFPELKEIINHSKTFRLQCLERLIQKSILEKELKATINANVLAKNFLTIGVGVMNHILLREKEDPTIYSIKKQYELLYQLAKV